MSSNEKNSISSDSNQSLLLRNKLQVGESCTDTRPTIASTSCSSDKCKVLFPGSFDPFTIGHASLVERALQLFGEIIIAVGYNEHKPGWLTPDERVRAIRALYNKESRVRVESYTGLTTDFAVAVGAKAILRGVRSLQDFEYELHMADINRQLTGIETICLFTLPEHAAISSSVVRELAHFDSDISPFLPNNYTPKFPN